MSRIKNRVGQRFGFWTVQSFVGLNSNFRAIWIIRCDCGTTKESTLKMLIDGTSKSCRCGLYKRTDYPIKHGHFVKGKQSPEYRSWAGMIARIQNPKHNRYQYYGGKGIKVCERWNDFVNFLSDMGLRPSPKHSLERKDGSKDYEPDNCCWATIQEQNWNKSNNIRIDVDGEIKSVKQCVTEYGIKATTIRDRLQRGWSDEATVKTPLRK